MKFIITHLLCFNLFHDLVINVFEYYFNIPTNSDHKWSHIDDFVTWIANSELSQKSSKK